MATSIANGRDEFARAALRLVHPSIDDPALRDTHGRFLRLAFVSPLFAPLIALAPPGANAAAIMAATCAALAIGWGAALVAMIAGRLAFAALALALSASGFLVFTAAATGTAGSPLLLGLAALPFEAYFVFRHRRAAAIAGLIALAGLISAAASIGGGAPATIAVHWIAPAIWVASAWSRLDGLRSRAIEPARSEVWEKLIDGVVLGFDRSGAVSTASAGSEALLGLKPGLLIGNGLFERLHVADRVDFLSAMAELRAGAPRRALALRVRAPAAAPGDGSGYLDLALDLAPESEGLAFAGWLRRAPQAPGRDMAGESSDQLEIAKSRFLAAVSHELRTPLNAIIGFSDMMLHGLFGPFADERQREYVGLISESGAHLLNVVNAILDVSKIEAGSYAIRPEPFIFADAVDMSTQMLARQAAAKNIAIDNTVSHDAAEVTGDRRAIQQILINLLSNAVKFTPEGGKIEVTASRRPGIFEFAVSDNGIGIAEADLSRLGQPFAQIENDLTRSYDGAGLGLSLVKGLVELYNGSMSIESAPGRGTTVRVGLPDVAGMSDTVMSAAQGKQHEAIRKFG